MPRWLGVDVGGSRKGFDVAVVDERQVVHVEGHLDRDAVVALIEEYSPALVAIDSPRCCAPVGQGSREGERLLARSICGIRWTPDECRVRGIQYYAWIREGLCLFAGLAERGVEAIEVFPTASWTRWFGRRGKRRRSDWSRQGLASLGLGGTPARTNQDERDAIAAAVTARQHTRGLTETLAEIVVPVSPLPP